MTNREKLLMMPSNRFLILGLLAACGDNNFTADAGIDAAPDAQALDGLVFGTTTTDF